MGGFYLLKSFIGSIGTIMRGSGLEDLIRIIYPGEGTVKHVMKGSAFYRSLRAHFLISKALADVSKEDNLTKDVLDRLAERERTTALWVLYLEMVAIVISFIRAERTSDFPLHLSAVRSMLPFFCSAGHHQYLKGARMTIQLYDSWNEKHPDLVISFLTAGKSSLD